MLVAFIAAAIVIRLAMLVVSVRHERALKDNGAIEIGHRNSMVLAGAHIAFYIAAATEGLWRAAPPDAVSLAGVLIYVFGIVMLLAVVRLLGRFWTVKLILARDHALVTHPLFSWVRHPNYFLNILPELLGFALALHAYATLAVGLPLYLIPLIIRIRQEERAMAERFPAY